MMRRKLTIRALLVFALIAVGTAHAIDPLPFVDQKQEQRFQAVATELRCLQCQNQNLADSDAALAKDMRLQIFEMMQTGSSDQQIKQYMIDRYGDFVIYTPPFNWQNAMLWLLPLLAALSGLSFVLLHFRARPERKNTSNNDVASSKSEVDAGDNW
jgi:cytochrome c-type biogenesis protein CcmH